jgi:streptomycin 6-kinase
LHGYLGLVVPVRRGGQLCVLKVTWVDDETRDEARALELGAGNGVVRLLDANVSDGVLLLERLDCTLSLAQIDIDEASAVAGRLLTRLAIPAPDDIPLLSDYAQRQALTMYDSWEKLGRPFPEKFVTAAQDAAKELGPSAKNLLINQDLHYENVLAGTREPWLVIDPKVISGDIEFSLAPLFWNRLKNDTAFGDLDRRFKILSNEVELDRRRAHGWILVRSVDYYLWVLTVGLTEDPSKCRLIMEWVLNDNRTCWQRGL